jgi:hypothetical protein
METNLKQAKVVIEMYPTKKNYAKLHNGETEYYRSCWDLIIQDKIKKYYNKNVIKILLTGILCLSGFIALILFFSK